MEQPSGGTLLPLNVLLLDELMKLIHCRHKLLIGARDYCEESAVVPQGVLHRIQIDGLGLENPWAEVHHPWDHFPLDR